MLSHRWTLTSFFASALISFFMTVSAAAVTEINDVPFEDSVTINNSRLTLRGVGLLRYMVFIKAYVGGFYLEEATDVADRFNDVPRRLELHYFHAIPAEDFAKATRTLIEKNTPPDRYAAFVPFIRQMNTLYRDVTPGDRYAATYIPGKGTELALNGTALGTVPDAEFSKAYFAMWLGANPIDSSFRDALLGR